LTATIVQTRGSVEFWSHVWFLLSETPWHGVSEETVLAIEEAATANVPRTTTCYVPMKMEEAFTVAKWTDNCLSTLNEHSDLCWWEKFRLAHKGAQAPDKTTF
jgi:hypothetical protein